MLLDSREKKSGGIDLSGDYLSKQEVQNVRSVVCSPTRALKQERRKETYILRTQLVMRYEFSKVSKESSGNRAKEAAETEVSIHKSAHTLKELACL